MKKIHGHDVHVYSSSVMCHDERGSCTSVVRPSFLKCKSQRALAQSFLFFSVSLADAAAESIGESSSLVFDVVHHPFDNLQSRSETFIAHRFSICPQWLSFR